MTPFGMMMRSTLVACALFSLLAPAAWAQGPARSAAPAPASRSTEGAAAPFDNDLQRLSEILGVLHYLRAVCGSKEGQKWRMEMQALLETEAPSGERRAKMIASFNRGYNGFQQTYRTCTPAASVAIKRYLDEGAKIAREVTARYSN